MIFPVVALSFISGSLASAWNTTVTAEVTSTFVTYCASPTTFTHNSKTYTVSEPTTLTLTECGCTESSGETSAAATSAAESAVASSAAKTSGNSTIAPTSAAEVANVAAANGVAAAGMLAAVAYLI